MDEEKMIYAKDFKCCIPECNEQAISFYPIFDIDQDTIPKPYCSKHLDEAKDRLMLAIFLEDERMRKRKT